MVGVFYLSQMLDYIIVGSGLAGIAFAEVAQENNKSVVVFNDNSQNSSKIAGGLYNPVVLKRFTPVWQAEYQTQLASDFYKKLEQKLNIKFDYKLPLLRKFYSAEEQNNWFIAADNPVLNSFLSTKIVANAIQYIPSDFGFGEVLHCGYVDVVLLLEKYRDELLKNNNYIDETFIYDDLQIAEDFVQYKNTRAKQIVFAEGFGLHLNPFFSNLPLDGTKGELLLIKAPKLKLEVIVKSSIFIVPIGNDYYKVGATYNWEDKTDIPTEEGKQELLSSLKELITCDFEVIQHYAGVRPTVKDRRPLVGNHPIHKNLYILNGLGTRGVILAPAMAYALYNFIENKEPLDKNIDITRIKNFASSFCQNEQKS